MSRSAAATPPPPFFPPKVSTPHARHTSAPTGTNAHYNKHHHTKKPRKHGFGGSSRPKPPAAAGLKAEALGLAFEDLPDFTVIDKPKDGAPLVRQPSQSSISTFHSAESFPSFISHENGGSTVPSMSSIVDSSVSLALQTPHNASVVSLPVMVQADPDMPPPSHFPNDTNSDAPVSAISVGHKGSWTANFGKMAKAVVHTGKSMGIPFGGERKKRDSQSAGASPVPSSPAKLATSSLLPQVPPAASTSANPQASRYPACSLAPIPRPTKEELAQLDPQAAIARKREWAEAEHNRVVECARLCSQWPQSGYNQSKWGPNGQSSVFSALQLSLTLYRRQSVL